MTTDLQRAAGYEVLALLLERGAADVDPELARLFDPSTNPDDLRSEYVAAFDLGVPPFASAFLEPDRCVGGQVTTAVGDRMGAHVGTKLAACHLATQLGHVARLLSARAWEPARRFVHDVVLAWLPTLSVVFDDQPVPFWRSVIRQALDLAADHAGGAAAAQWSAPLEPAEVPLPLGERAGLADIATWLSTPAAAGTFVSDHDLVTIGRLTDLPRGFGSRAQRLETMLRSAADYGAVGALTEALTQVLERRKGALESLAESHVHEALVNPWLERLHRGLHVVETLAEAGSRNDG